MKVEERARHNKFSRKFHCIMRIPSLFRVFYCSRSLACSLYRSRVDSDFFSFAGLLFRVTTFFRGSESDICEIFVWNSVFLEWFWLQFVQQVLKIFTFVKLILRHWNLSSNQRSFRWNLPCQHKTNEKLRQHKGSYQKKVKKSWPENEKKEEEKSARVTCQHR